MGTYPTRLTTGEVGSDYDSKALIGNDSCLNFDGVNQYIECSSATVGNISTAFSLSCFFKINAFEPVVMTFWDKVTQSEVTSTPNGWEWFVLNNGVVQLNMWRNSTASAAFVASAAGEIKEDIWYFLTFVRDGDVYKIYKNGVKIAERNNSDRPGVFNATDPMRFGRRNYDAFSYHDINLNNAVVFDKALTDFEVLNLYNSNGQPQLSLHTNVVAHYPLSQRESHIVVTGDEALNKGLSLGDYAVWDVSEKYNYAKTTPLTAQHGKLVNYAANEVGVDALQNNTSFKNFYCSDVRYSPIGKNYNSTNSEYDTISSWTNFLRTQPLTIVFRYKHKNTGLQRVLSNRNATINGNKGFEMQISDSSNNFGFGLFNSGSTGVFVRGGSWGIPEPGKEYIVIFTYAGDSNANNIRRWINGNEEVPTIVLNNLTSGIATTEPLNIGSARSTSGGVLDSFANDVYYNLEILNIDKSGDSAFIEYVSKCGSAYGYVPNSEFLLGIDFSKNNGQISTLPSTPSYSIQAYKSGSTFNPKIGDGTYIESKTELPPLTECLKFGSEGGYVDFDTTNSPSESYTFLMVYKDSDRIIPSNGSLGRVYGEIRQSGYSTTNGVAHRFMQYNSTTSSSKRVGLLSRNRTNNISNFAVDVKSYQQNTSYSDFDHIRIGVFVYNHQKQELTLYNNSLKSTVSSPTSLTNIGYHRFGSSNYSVNTGESLTNAYQDWYMLNYGYWKRALEPWEIKELYNNQLIYNGNPFNWTNSQNTGFQDQMEIWHQFQSNSIYWDGSNYRVTNYGNGADATLSNYTTGSDDFVTDNPDSIVNINSLR